MSKMGHLDLESKKGKAPGGFMYPLYEIGVPFIYMNAVGTQRDLVTMLHEGGHAIHSFLSRDLKLTEFKSTPSEVAELASMSMELISMKHWDIFYQNNEELKRAKKEQLVKALEGLPWIAAIDKFQHWIYTNEHTSEERKNKWLEINSEFGNKIIDWSGQEKYLEILKADPSHSDANHNFGLLTVKLGEPAMGVQFLRTAIETDPTVADYWISIINTLMEIKDFENAKVAIEKAKEVGHIGGVFEKLASNLEFLRNEKVESESV